jgi:hypothetical protein
MERARAGQWRWVTRLAAFGSGLAIVGPLGIRIQHGDRLLITANLAYWWSAGLLLVVTVALDEMALRRNGSGLSGLIVGDDNRGSTSKAQAVCGPTRCCGRCWPFSLSGAGSTTIADRSWLGRSG